MNPYHPPIELSERVPGITLRELIALPVTVVIAMAFSPILLAFFAIDYLYWKSVQSLRKALDDDA